MAVSWPTSLQQCLSDESFAINKGETTIRSDMDIGPQKVRRRFTRSIDEITCSIYLTKDQWVAFEYFYNTLLAGGVLPFTFDHPITKIPTVFRFKAQPSYGHIGGGNFTVSMVWEQMP